MAKHATYFFSQDAQAQAAFYVQALGGEVVSVQKFDQMPNTSEADKNKVLHLHLVAAGVTFYMCDSFGPVHQGNAISQCLEFETEAEAHEAFANLASEGGKVTHELRKEFWGALFGQVEDKFGVQWMITTTAPAMQA
ncbi:VOC family protein [Paenibacillus sp. HJGM_3]|uniref:VOC family protein n=1 Tax=Paenibacillus sp. HJGM_3 TaxID=3379816 RepID=UPI00385C04D4